MKVSAPIYTLPLPLPDQYSLSYALVSHNGDLLRTPDIRLVGDFIKRQGENWQAPALLTNGEHGYVYCDGTWSEESSGEVQRLLKGKYGEDYKNGSVKGHGFSPNCQTFKDLSKSDSGGEWTPDWVGDPNGYAQAQIGLHCGTWIIVKAEQQGYIPLPSEFHEPLSIISGDYINKVYGFGDGNGILAGISRDRSKILYFNENAQNIFELLQKGSETVLTNKEGAVLWSTTSSQLRPKPHLMPEERDLYIDQDIDIKEQLATAVKALSNSSFEKFVTFPSGSYSPPDYSETEGEDEDDIIEGIVQIVAWDYRDEFINPVIERPHHIDSCFSTALRYLEGDLGAALPYPTLYPSIFYCDSSKKALWKLSDRYLVIEKTELFGDGERIEQLALITVPLDFYSSYEYEALARSLYEQTPLKLDPPGSSIPPESLGTPSNIRFLSLKGNSLTFLPEWLDQLTSLEALDLSNNQFTSLPESLTQQVNLQVLDISNNQLSEIPDTLSQLKDLRMLNLADNDIISLPESLSYLSNLMEIDLCNNFNISVPESLREQEQLEIYDDHDENADVDLQLHDLGNIDKINANIEEHLIGFNNPLRFLHALFFDRTRLKQIGMTIFQIENLISVSSFTDIPLQDPVKTLEETETFHSLASIFYKRCIKRSIFILLLYLSGGVLLNFLYGWIVVPVIFIISAVSSLKTLFTEWTDKKKLDHWYMAIVSQLKNPNISMQVDDSPRTEDADPMDVALKLDTFCLEKEKQNWSVKLFDLIANVISTIWKGGKNDRK